MSEYMYKGFILSYELEPKDQNTQLYKLNGYIKDPEIKDKSSLVQVFHTEDLSEELAKKEIIKLMTDYIDFEWREFHECADISDTQKQKALLNHSRN